MVFGGKFVNLERHFGDFYRYGFGVFAIFASFFRAFSKRGRKKSQIRIVFCGLFWGIGHKQGVFAG